MKTILTHLREHVESQGDRVCVELVSRRRGPGRRTFGEIWEEAGRAAAFYKQQGIERGDIVVLIGTHHLGFYAAWLGAVWIGAIPTVLAEPSVRIDRAIYAERLAALLERVEARAIAADPSIEVHNPAAVPILSYDAVMQGALPVPPMIAAAPDDLLLLQHSSGTTGLQKGVMLSHGAVARHSDAYRSAIQARSEDVVVSWLPLYHDMGLIACFILPLIVGMKVVWLSPFEWVSNPGTLLEAVTAHRATLAWLPNFGFPFLAQRTRGTYDLSSLRGVINCSEPVSEDAMRIFEARFRDQGLDPTALQACYALAENVFAVATTRASAPRRVLAVDRRPWLEEHRAVDGGDDTVEFVSSGTCIEGCVVVIADDEGRPLPPRHAGRLLIRSPFLFGGYFRRDDLNRTLFDEAGFFDTGDVGFVDEEGHLYVTGRRKDLIIVGGRNIYPQDVEQVASETEGVYPGRVVCFGVPVARNGTEGLVVLAESEAASHRWPSIGRSIKKNTAARLDLDVLDARVVARRSLRKSTSGKLARDGNRSWYLEGRFGTLPKILET